MGKTRATMALVLFLGLGGACNRQDTECLGSIGRKVMVRAGTATAPFREKIDSLKIARPVLDTLQEKVSARFRWEKVLADLTLEVVVTGNEIELKGIVKTAEQRSRAVELAESTTGVERVLVNLTLADSGAP